MQDDLNRKGRLVTGAVSGIGKVIRDGVHRNGVSVLLRDLNEKALDDAARELGSRAIGASPMSHTRTR